MQETAELIRSSRFRAEREADWRRLEALVARAERGGVHGMDFADARDLAELYRQAATSLAVAREISLDRALLDYLEALTARKVVGLLVAGAGAIFLILANARGGRVGGGAVFLGSVCFALNCAGGHRTAHIS